MITLTREEAQQVLDALGYWDNGVDEHAIHLCVTAIETLRARLSAPEPEPVAWRFDQAKYRENDLRGRQWAFNVFSQSKPYMDEMVRNVTPLYKDPTPCQTCEALARTVMMDQTSHDTAPPQREWQGLTDEEILADDVLRYHFGLNGGAGPVSKKGKAVIAAIEAKLKEKNT
jgi:hypothetical protein